MTDKIREIIKQIKALFSQPPVVSSPPKMQVPSQVNKANDPWAINYPKAMLRGMLAGTLVPVCTNPLIQFEANVSIGKSLKASWALMLKSPWKGYSFAALTHMVRAGLLFNTTPVAKDFYEKQGITGLKGKMLAFGTAGAVEGSMMSLRFLFLHQIHTTSALTLRDAYRAMPRQDLFKLWGIACRYGMARDMSFWPVWALTVDTIENQLLVNKQQETVAKWWEEFLIGASAGVVSSPVSYPIHAALRKRLHQPEVSTCQDLKNVATYAAQSGQSLWKVMPKHVYKGFVPAALMILPTTMGMTNVAKHAADIAYEKGRGASFFKPVQKRVAVLEQNEKKERADEFLMKMSSC